MKVVVAGGYGVFGSRLAELLIRDRHDVTVAGRQQDKAQSLAEQLGCAALTVDISVNPERLFASRPDVVIDAIGPFQDYVGDRYRVARLCIENQAHYLDLSDDADFSAGIVELNAAAQAAGCFVLSGASSVPGLSSAVAAELCDDFDEVLLIDSAIVPGNRAPRGTSVMTSIIGQLGEQRNVWRGGRWRTQTGWGDRRLVDLGNGIKRAAYFIEVPDIRLFPAFFRARSVMFRAGMELPVMNVGMRLLAALRSRVALRIPKAAIGLIRGAANLLLPFGSDRGGMRVRVVGRREAEVELREWRLLAESGDGSYVPAVVSRAILRSAEKIRPGARPCIAEMTRADIERALADLQVTFDRRSAPCPTLFQRTLENHWSELPQSVQKLHSVYDLQQFSGAATVTRGCGWLARLIAAAFRFPRAGRDVAVTVTITATEDHEVWERNFGGRVFRAYCSGAAASHCYRERFGPFSFEIELTVVDGSLEFPVRRGWFLGLELPKMLLPASVTREFEQDGVFHFDVALHGPLGIGLIVRYRGQLEADT